MAATVAGGLTDLWGDEGREPGSPMRPYGDRSPFEKAARKSSRPGPLAGTGSTLTPLENLYGIITPSALHFEQSRECLRAGRHVLSELPPCIDPREAEELGAIAQQQGVLLGCAHTSRYLAPYARIHAALKSGLIGEIQEVSYVRYLQLQPRTWTDSALVHHGAHIIDLVLQWCGKLKPIACAAFPNASSAQSVSILAALPGGKPLTATISYAAKIPISRMVVVGATHTVETDGFSYLRSDLEELQFIGDERAVYEQAIAAQDEQFLGACRGKTAYIPWAETEDLMRMIHQFQVLSAAKI